MAFRINSADTTVLLRNKWGHFLGKEAKLLKSIPGPTSSGSRTCKVLSLFTKMTGFASLVDKS